MLFVIARRPRNDGVSLSSEALPYRMWYDTVPHAVGYAQFRAGLKSARIEIRDGSGEIVETIHHDPDGKRETNTLGGL